MKIKTRLFGLGGLAMVGLLVLMLISQRLTQEVQQISQAALLVSKLEVVLLNLRRNEKDFLLRQDLKYATRFEQNTERFYALEQQLDGLLRLYRIEGAGELTNNLADYQQRFAELVELYQAQGLVGDSGTLIQIKQRLAQLNSGWSQTESWQASQLLEQAKLGTFEATSPYAIALFDAPQLLAWLPQLAQRQRLIGIDYQSGVKGEVRASSHIVERQFDQFAAAIEQSQLTTISELQQFKWAAMVLVSGLLVLLVWLTARHINDRLRSLLLVIRNITSSNNVSMRAPLVGNDELTTLARYFNGLLEQIEQLVTGSQLKSKDLSMTTVEMEQQLLQVIAQYRQQAEHTDGMAAAVQQMVCTIEEISQSSTLSLQGVQQASANATAGRHVVDNTVASINQLSNQLVSSRSSVASLSTKVASIQQAVAVIREVAEQISLLALNASIEAARAGQHGRGFAVVANEVQSLAAKTHQANEQIAELVGDVGKQMQQTESEIDDCNRQGAATLNHSNELDVTLKQIIDDMQRIQGGSEQVAAAMLEQSTVMKQVGDSVGELKGLSQSNGASAQRCLQEVSLVAEQAQQMNHAVAAFKVAEAL